MLLVAESLQPGQARPDFVLKADICDISSHGNMIWLLSMQITNERVQDLWEMFLAAAQ